MGPETSGLFAVESFSGYAVRYLKPEVTQSWRVGRAARRPVPEDAGVEEELLTRGSGRGRRDPAKVSDSPDLRQSAMFGASERGDVRVPPSSVDTPIPLARPSSVLTRIPVWTAMDRSPCLSTPCK